MAQTISPELEKFLKEPVFCQIATLMPDGSPQITQVWVDTDGQHILVNTCDGRQKYRNVKRDPRVALNIVDTANAWRVASIRGRVVEMTRDGADASIDALAKKYVGKDKYPFGRPGDVRMLLKIQPEKINSMGLG